MTLPTFIVAGIKKAATTSIYEYLGQHPQIYVSPIKETNFFAYEPDNPEFVETSRKQFPIRTLDEYEALFAGAAGETAFGDVSPVYIRSRYAIDLMRKLVPDVKLIFCLRHPADRLYSLYLMDVRDGREQRSIDEYVDEEQDLLRTLDYFSLLRPWYDAFGAEQIKIVLFEELRDAPQQTMAALYDFIGVDSQFLPDMSVVRNKGGVPKNQFRHNVVNYLRRYRRYRGYVPSELRSQFTRFAQRNLAPPPGMPSDVRQTLERLYGQHIGQLGEMTGTDFSCWQLGFVEQVEFDVEYIER